jgi:hypothetical protein
VKIHLRLCVPISNQIIVETGFKFSLKIHQCLIN